MGAGILNVPVSVDVTYEIEAVTTEDDLASDEPPPGVREVRFRTRAEALAYLERTVFGGRVPFRLDPGREDPEGHRTLFLLPEDSALLAVSPALPPPVWEDAPGFATGEEIGGYLAGLADLQVAPLARVPVTFRWGPQRPDLVRYNRVEALSLGARAQVRPNTPVGPVSLTLTGRLGVADVHPNGSFDATRETLDRRITVRAYHELAAIDERARHLEIGNSVLAVTAGRDDGDYYRSSGGAVEVTPPTAGRRTYRVRGWAERHEGVEAETDFALFHLGSDDWAFRPNLPAEEGWEYGAGVELSPYWGTDPNLTQGGVEASVQGVTGDFDFARAALVGRLVVPLPARLRVALEAGGGGIWGTPSVQRLWYVGGPTTLRGYAPRAAGGTAFARARAELARGTSLGRVSAFSDFGWAGQRDRVRLGDGLVSVGVGLSILDGLIRLDGAWGLRSPRDFRLDLYLDQLL